MIGSLEVRTTNLLCRKELLLFVILTALSLFDGSGSVLAVLAVVLRSENHNRCAEWFRVSRSTLGLNAERGYEKC